MTNSPDPERDPGKNRAALKDFFETAGRDMPHLLGGYAIEVITTAAATSLLFEHQPLPAGGVFATGALALFAYNRST